MRTLRAPRVGIEDIADEQDLALEDLVRIGREHDIDGLALDDQRGVLLGDIGRDPDGLQVGDRHDGSGRIVEECALGDLQVDHAAGHRRLHG